MPVLPAFCNDPRCGTIFPSGFSLSNARNVSLAGNESGPCPRCGKMGHVPDGLYSFVGDIIQVIAAPERTIQEYALLEELLRGARAKGQSAEEVVERIKNEAPQFAQLADFLPRTGADLAGYLGLLVSTVALFVQISQHQPSPSSVTVNQVLERVVVEAPADSNSQQLHRPVSKKARPNDPCTCGSGKKYKHCCGSKK